MRTISIILYFLFLTNGYGGEVELSIDSCEAPERNSQEAIVEHAGTQFAKFSKRILKKSNKQNKNQSFGDFYTLKGDPFASMYITYSNGLNSHDGLPKINASLKKHTFYNTLFFPPDETEVA